MKFQVTKIQLSAFLSLKWISNVANGYKTLQASSNKGLYETTNFILKI